MRIVSLEVFPIALPFRERYRTARGELDARTMAVVRLHCSDGTIGLGEAVPLSLRGGPDLGRVRVDLASCGSALAGTEATTPVGGDPVAIRDWVGSLIDRCQRLPASPQAIAAVDVALHDLAGRLSGMPLWRLLGASRGGPVDCNASLDAAEPDRAAVRASELARDGFTTFKIKVGAGRDHERVRAVREAVGAAARIRLDANGAWDAARALEMLRELDAVELELIEQPCPDLAGLAAVRARTQVPVVADESVASEADAAAAVAADACDAATLKLAKVGGPLAALRISERIPSYLSSALDGPIGIAAAIHTAQALPGEGPAADYAHGLATLTMFESCYADTAALSAPAPAPSPRPGLGLDVDPRTLREFELR